MIQTSEKKEILILKNIAREDAGILGDIIRENGIRHKIIDLSKGEYITSVENYGAVVVLGGPDSANDETLKMKTELALIHEVLEANIPFLGICLGLQTLVKASHGEVVECPVKEAGFRDREGKFFTVELTEEGRRDPLFNGINDSFNVFHLHGETVILPENMALLATGKNCRNQIVKAGSCSYGIQCHFELTEELLETWINEDPDLQKMDKYLLLSDYRSLSEGYKQTGRRIFRNFLIKAGYLQGSDNY
jgi:GMP synthase (glutamine-hydrolysing)